MGKERVRSNNLIAIIYMIVTSWNCIVFNFFKKNSD